MTPLEQYALLLTAGIGVVLFVAALYLIGRGITRTLSEQTEIPPFDAGRGQQKPAWARYHVHYYGFALLFLAFDMEMAYMYPWAVVYREIGISALVEMGIFLLILFLGILYGWSEGALRRQ